VVFLGYTVCYTNKTDCHDIAEILLKVLLKTITTNPQLVSLIVLQINRSNSVKIQIPESTTTVSDVRVSRPLVFCVVICWPLFVPLSFLMLPLYCLSFFNVRLLITPFVFSNLQHLNIQKVIRCRQSKKDREYYRKRRKKAIKKQRSIKHHTENKILGNTNLT
jgi:hypothetical protein